MEKYLLLRNNEQTGPFSYENLIGLGLLPHDLIWIEGKSASWKYPAEMEEFMNLIPASILPGKRYDRPPIYKTHLQNDDLLLHDLDSAKNEVHRVISDNELMEFPTLARFIMADYYEQQLKKSQQKKPEQPDIKKHLTSTGVWVSLPSKTEKKIVLISSHSPAEAKSSVDSPELITPMNEKVFSEEVMNSNSHHFAENDRGKNVAAENNTIDPVPTDKTIRHFFHLDGSIVHPQKEETTEFHFESTYKRKPVVPLQWLSVAVALASMLMVGILIVDSMVNPGYSKSAPAKNEVKETSDKPQPNPATDQSAEHALYAGAAAVVPTVRLTSDSLAGATNKNAVSEPPAAADKKISSVKKVTVKKPEVLPAVEPDPVPLVPSAAEQAEKQAEEALQQEKAEARKNISRLVQIQTNDYKVGMFGGIRDFDVVVKNNSNFEIDRVVVEVRYIQSNKKVFKTETLEFRDIAAKSDRRIEVPKSARGVKVETSIRSIDSEKLSLSYSN